MHIVPINFPWENDFGILHSVAEGNMMSKLEVEGPTTGSLFQSNKGYDISIARIEG
ncbi:hypothetical protein BDR06DRAFT_964594 [Suillus hirtellus]|nr:hypothetical protein BDR06DRAFT_964594 [Suillus hirtellus]